MIITIDGPSGTGKSAIAKLLAKKLNFEYFDTGAMYRALTYYILENDLDSDEKIVNSLGKFSFKIQQIDDEKEYFVNNTNVTHIIREDKITNNVSKFSSKKIIREFLVKIQKSYARYKNAVFEGRDMGSVVFPKANYKFFLTAKDRIRAKRRYLQLRENFPDTNFSIEKILEEQKQRDKIDSNRKISPLKCPKNAIVLDTSNLTIKEVIENLMKKIKKRRKLSHITQK